MITSQNDIEDIYNKGIYYILSVSCCSESKNEYEIILGDKNNQRICLLQREYCNEIVYHKLFFIYNEYIRKGHGRQIHNNECEGYKKHNIKTIKILEAIFDGILVWLKLGFKLDCSANDILNIEKNILFEFREYLSDIIYPDNPKKVYKIMSKCSSINDLILPEYKNIILPKNKKCFTEYLSDKPLHISSMPMKKELI